MSNRRESKPKLSAARAVEIWRTMLSLRDELFPEGGFHTMVEAWEKIVDGAPNWSIKRYSSNSDEELSRQAGVIAFADAVTLTVDRRLLRLAEERCGFSNFILGHEIAHLELGHHSRASKTLNFLLAEGRKGNSVIPQNQLELEANFGGVVFQCGRALLEKELSARDLAKRSYSDPELVKWAQRLVQLDAFTRELARQSLPKERVVL